jgi:hypothetical protein
MSSRDNRARLDLFSRRRPIEQEMFSGMSKTVFIPSVPATSEDDFEVSATSKLAGYRRFFGVLKVVRTGTARGHRWFEPLSSAC